MKTFGLFTAGFVVGTIILVATGACGKKTVEAVNPQITDAVTQTVVSSEAADAGKVPVTGAAVLEEAQALKQEVKEVLQSLPDAGVVVSPAPSK
jgi:hypothetical protein